MKVYKIDKDKNGNPVFNLDKDDRKKIDMYLDNYGNRGIKTTEEFYEDGKTLKSLTSYLGNLKFYKLCVDTDGCICQYTLYVD